MSSAQASAEPLTPPSSRPLRLPRTLSPRFSSLGLKVSFLSPFGSSFSVGDACFFFFLLLSHLQSDRNSLLALPSESVSESPCSLYSLATAWVPVLFRLGHQTLWLVLGLCAPLPLSSQCSSWSNALTMSLKSCYSFAQKPSNGSVPMK